MYGTQFNADGACYCYSSTDLMEWTPIGYALDTKDAVIGKVAASDIWAPEVIYDSETELYYMFFSATPNTESLTLGADEKAPNQLLYVAVSESPTSGFELVDFTDKAVFGSDARAEITDDAHYFARYLLFDPAEYKAFEIENGGTMADTYAGYASGIDPHPYVENGKKYLLWTDSRTDVNGSDRICIVEMEDWLTPKWDSENKPTVLTYHGYYTVEDWKKAQTDSTVEKADYELSATINEGPVLTKHNGKYYLTFSVNKYTDNTYKVIQAVSTDGILGPYRKLTEAEGGILLEGNSVVTGTGHHSFVTVEGQTYIVYHRHNDTTTQGAARNHAIDEVKWITNDNDLEIMYVNGPTLTEQAGIGKFVDITDAVTSVTSSDSSITNAYNLVDGMLSIQNSKETSISKTTTFTLRFDLLKKVNGIMIYNSNLADTSFDSITKVELIREEDNKVMIHYIENLSFDSKNRGIPGAAAYAAFDELDVDYIRITVDVPSEQSSVGISEVKILSPKE